VDESIECSNEVFGDPLYLQAKECQCKRATYDFVDSSNCGQGLEIVSAQACKAAADTLGITYNKESMRGRWTHTPPGCFVHKGCTQGCRLHFGTGNGNNDGRYRAICNVAQATWDRCACEHNGHRTFSDCTRTNICQCRGEVRYGYGDTWSISKQVDESIECSNEVFGDPLFLQAKECQCKQAALVPPGGRRLEDFARADWDLSNSFTVLV